MRKCKQIPGQARFSSVVGDGSGALPRRLDKIDDVFSGGRARRRWWPDRTPTAPARWAVLAGARVAT